MKTTFFLIVLLCSMAVLRASSTIQFAQTNLSVSEVSGNVSLNLVRAGDTNTAVTVDYGTADGTATAGLGYTATQGTLNFGPGDTERRRSRSRS